MRQSTLGNTTVADETVSWIFLISSRRIVALRSLVAERQLSEWSAAYVVI